MIITIIFAVLTILGIIGIILYCSWIGPFGEDTSLGISVVLFVVGLLGLLVCATFIGKAQIGKQVEYDITLLEQQNLQARITDGSFRVLGNEMVYHDALELNKKLARVKYWSDNPWVNWFFNEKLADIDYIIFE